MGDHSLDSPTDDFTPVDPAPSPKVEAKLVVATTVAALLYGVLQVVQANTEVLTFLPPWAQQITLAILPGLIAFLAGYRVPSNRV